MTVFDAYIMVDWSASNKPVRGKNSIWIAEGYWTSSGISIKFHNPTTRATAYEVICGIASRHMSLGKRVCAGFDFSFGYPSSAVVPVFKVNDWRGVWSILHDQIEDTDENCSNRFEFANKINMHVNGPGPFWNVPESDENKFLTRKRPSRALAVQEFRHVEVCSKKERHRPQSVWKLSTAGAVGSQTLLGIHWLEKLRRTPLPGSISVWPFETKFNEDIPDHPSLTLVEIYPSLWCKKSQNQEILDKEQMRAAVKKFSQLDAENSLDRLLGPPISIDAQVKQDVLLREGWIAGIGQGNPFS